MLGMATVFVWLSLGQEALAAANKNSGGTYEGQKDRRGRPHGEGTYRWNNGKVYVGEWRQSEASGKGKVIEPDGSSVEGNWLEGKPYGEVTKVTPSGERTVGTLTDGLLAGPAEVHLTNGDSYQGTWELGVRVGEVIYTFENGDVYKGHFKDGKPHGSGDHTYVQTGNRFSGNFVKGAEDGSGTMFFANGANFNGKWRKTKSVGLGRFTDRFGESIEILYSNFTSRSTVNALQMVSKEETSDGLSGQVFMRDCDNYSFELNMNTCKRT